MCRGAGVWGGDGNSSNPYAYAGSDWLGKPYWCIFVCTYDVLLCAAGVYTVDDPTIVKLDREVRAAMQRGGLS